AQEPRASPSINTEITTDSTGVMMPNDANASRVQITWYNKPQNPETKKRANKSGRLERRAPALRVAVLAAVVLAVMCIVRESNHAELELCVPVLAINSNARCATFSTGHNRPKPSYPQESSPSSGPINSAPRDCKTETFCCVAACSHILPFIAG